MVTYIVKYLYYTDYGHVYIISTTGLTSRARTEFPVNRRCELSSEVESHAMQTPWTYSKDTRSHS